MSVITPYHWYIFQPTGNTVYLRHMPGPELVDRPAIEVRVTQYSVDKNMTLHVYAVDEAGHLVDYTLSRDRQHQDHRQRTYSFTLEFVAGCLQRHAAAEAAYE
jgi:hypothetical protein